MKALKGFQGDGSGIDPRHTGFSSIVEQLTSVAFLPLI